MFITYKVTNNLLINIKIMRGKDKTKVTLYLPNDVYGDYIKKADEKFVKANALMVTTLLEKMAVWQTEWELAKDRPGQR